MGYRFRKSIKAGPVRFTYSKSGVGWSIGGKGGRYTKLANGRSRYTVNTPIKGVTYVSEGGSKKRKNTSYSSPPQYTSSNRYVASNQYMPSVPADDSSTDSHLTETFFEKVVGVSYNNDDGSSRQEYIRQLKDFEELELELFEYEGAPAVRVNTQRGQCIGFLRKELAPKIHNYYAQGCTMYTSVLSILGKDGNGEWISGYYAGVRIFIVVHFPEGNTQQQANQPFSVPYQPPQYQPMSYAPKKELTRNDCYTRAALWLVLSCGMLFPVSIYYLCKSIHLPNYDGYTQQYIIERTPKDYYIAAALWFICSFGLCFPLSIYDVWKAIQITDRQQFEEIKNEFFNFIEKIKKTAIKVFNVIKEAIKIS